MSQSTNTIVNDSIKYLKEDIEYLDKLKTDAYWEYMNLSARLISAKMKLNNELNKKCREKNSSPFSTQKDETPYRRLA